MQIRLKTKLTLAFLCVTLVLIALISVMANVILKNQFEAYAIDKQNQRIEGLVDLFASRYADWGGQWDISGIETIGVNMLDDGLLLRVSDTDGQVLWDARVHNNGRCNAILANIAETMSAYHHQVQGGYVEKNFEIVTGGRTAGHIDIGYYGPFFYTQADISFLDALNQLLLGAAVLSLLGSMAVGALLARQLTRPITRVIRTTRSIAGGNFAERIHEQTDTREIDELTDAVNNLAETLDEQESLRKRLVSDVAHELRTPITILQSHLEAMIDGTWAADTEHLENCHGETVRISRLVDDLQKLTLLEKGNLNLDCVQFDLAGLLQKLVANFRRDFDEKHVRLVLEAGSEPIAADVDKLSQVFMNLLANALKYTDAGGEVAVSLAAQPQGLVVTVRDTGIGIAREDLPRIFERFYRTDKSRARQTGGAGIGLTIAKAIVEAHQGTLTAESEPGHGSVFIVTLPRAPKCLDD